MAQLRDADQYKGKVQLHMLHVIEATVQLAICSLPALQLKHNTGVSFPDSVNTQHLNIRHLEVSCVPFAQNTSDRYTHARHYIIPFLQRPRAIRLVAKYILLIDEYGVRPDPADHKRCAWDRVP